MSYKISPSKQFKKDFKRISGDPKKIKGLKVVIDLLLATGQLSKEYRPHQLSGNWKPHWECHVFPDFLLIWFQDDENMEIKLKRCGSHSELFG